MLNNWWSVLCVMHNMPKGLKHNGSWAFEVGISRKVTVICPMMLFCWTIFMVLLWPQKYRNERSDILFVKKSERNFVERSRRELRTESCFCRKLVIMSTVHFQSQLTSIMEMLAKTAVVEICKLFEENYSLLGLEITRCTNENDSLRKKCVFLETELQAARRSAAMISTEHSFSSGLAGELSQCCNARFVSKTTAVVNKHVFGKCKCRNGFCGCFGPGCWRLNSHKG